MIPKNFPRLIGFCGYARTGKDTTYECLSKLIESKYDFHGIKRIAFADKVKEHLKPLSDICKNLGYDISIPENKETFRPMYVEWSNVLKKLTNNQTIWLDLVKKEIDLNIHDLENIVFITDVRYWYEIDFILSNNGKVIFLEKSNTSSANSEEEQSFKQIKEMYENEIKKYIVYNNDTKEKLAENCLNLLLNNL